jgi:AcrR family transcriptional regulator
MSPRIRTADRERAMIDAALEVFLEKGFEGTTMLEIATRAHVGKGTLYGLARSKEDLCLRVLVDRFQQMTAELTQAIPEPGDPMDVLQRLIRETGKACAQQVPVMWLCTELMARANCNEELREQVKRAFSAVYAQFFAPIESLLRSAVEQGQIPDCDAHSLARLITALLDGLTYQFMIEGERFDPSRVVEMCLDMLSCVLGIDSATEVASKEERS